MPEDEAFAVAENLLEALRFFGHAREDAEIRDLKGVSLIFCGLNYAAFNAALQATPIQGDSGELARLIEVSAQHYDVRNLRWTYWLCDDFLPPPVQRDAWRVFQRHGLRHLTEAPGMYTDRLTPATRALPTIDVRPVGDKPTRAAFAEVMSTAFEIPHSVSVSVYGAERAWQGTFQGYVGYSNGRAVTTAAAVVTNDVVGLYSVATLPQHRRLGFAEAIMRQVIAEAEEKRGVSRTVLQATSSGMSLYEAMGYRTVTNFNVFIAD
ncbi:MAG TPA: GNAT family N-acetyltransferase [Bryobacteraceae bacterium]|nr:GNAT family N-acetyltransferase [Bryobacteraceae bacterium]